MSLLGLVLPVKGSRGDTKSNDTNPIGLHNKRHYMIAIKGKSLLLKKFSNSTY